MEKAPSGTHSTKALGQFAPSEKTYEKLNGEDITVPVGKIASTGNLNCNNVKSDNF
jgi:hypothetical protein